MKASIIVAAVFLATLVGGFAIYYNPEIVRNLSGIINNSRKTPSHEELINFSLSLINTDRQLAGLKNVTLSPIKSGQQHAEDMLNYQYFSHWDKQGYKPYIRYTLAGGKGAVMENIAAQLGYISNLTDAIKDLERQMIYNDSASDWGHKENILNSLHNKVSIGVAYDRDSLYLVQDFEDSYIDWSTLKLSGTTIEMNGTITKPNLNIEQVGIYYDNPTNLTTQQLANPPYQGSYSSGTYIGAVVPTGYMSGQGITITAQTWNQTGQEFELKFDLALAFVQEGKGAYTLYLWTSNDNYLTTYSILYSG